MAVISFKTKVIIVYEWLSLVIWNHIFGWGGEDFYMNNPTGVDMP